ncbi:pirin family protein [Paracoccus sanguinis]|uniref:Quercetin 2,3-dioxygenase n=1 Tax=Paracoccus sanguinis TaxID=1545044 RepID=A0A099GM69_9RHOB|nr:pirin family protein [Paracoccus sanguinis]KGJ14556.1 quercetin 2,3-dioxygenase [Paracoccus sanguinis]KGJ23208.1 quercetin 2,3-dioxygenase [Paracoccus sanguinis]
MRKIVDTTTAPRGHWVGDGFPVRSLFSHMSGRSETTPFLMLDYGGPHHFEPATRPRGVDVHPHKGFETVTIVYEGEVEHGDSTGRGGVIGRGDVQWMTAGDGILHKEFHSHDYTARGGMFEMVQLWVNLRGQDKSAAPGYQSITDAQIPAVDLPDGAGRVRVIAGSYGDAKGPASTFTPMDVLDLRLNAGATTTLTPPEGWNVLVVALSGEVTVNAEARLTGPAVARLSREGGGVVIEAASDAKLLFLAGEPIDEPIAAYGPFVMNTEGEIRQAIQDFNAGKFGRL